jgi:predicted RNase H-like HicB family nuclease
MKTYLILIKQAKAEIEQKQKELNQILRDKLNLEQQIELLIETFEHEQNEISLHKSFFNPKYFDRVSNKIKAYSHVLRTKNDEYDALKDEIFGLFSRRKQYEILLENLERRLAVEHQQKEALEIEDLFRPDSR